MRLCDAQHIKVICCNRFLLSVYVVNIFNDRIIILEYPGFVVIRKESRFTMKIFYLGVNILSALETALDQGFVEQFLEAIKNREPTGFLSNLGIQYIIHKLLPLLPLESLRHV